MSIDYLTGLKTDDMRYFILPMLLIAPLLLSAQSKKEQIITLNIRVDSLFELLENERISNSQSLIDKSDKIFLLSKEKEILEKEISVKNNTLDGFQVQWQEAGDVMQSLRTELRDCNAHKAFTYTEIMKFDRGEEPDGGCDYWLFFKGSAAGGWKDDWTLSGNNCVDFWHDPDGDDEHLISGQIYLVTFEISYNRYGYHRLYYRGSRDATIKEINEINQQFLEYEPPEIW